MTLEELRDLAMEYDSIQGMFPENTLEGFSFFDWLKCRLEGPPEPATPEFRNSDEAWKRHDEWNTARDDRYQEWKAEVLKRYPKADFY